jgi:hypothetical protein
LRTQWWKPTQSIRVPLRLALRLHNCTRHCGGRAFSTYASAFFIAARWRDMQVDCHWQLIPMFSATGS